MSAGELGSLRWTRRAYLLYGAGTTLLIVGLLFRNPLPLFLALPWLLAPPAAALFDPKEGAVASVVWGSTGSATEVEVAGQITPVPPLRPEDLVVRFDRPPGFAVTRPARVEFGGETVEFDLAWKAREPILATVPLPSVAWEDPLGLATRPVRLTGEPLRVDRFAPELLRLGRVHLHRTTQFPGETVARTVGTSGEFFALREAAPSDPPRRINWRATARSGRRIANDYRLERTGDVLLLVDARPSELGDASDTRLLGLEAASAFGIAEMFLREKARVGLAVFGEFVDAVPLGSGPMQRFRLRNALFSARPSSIAGPPARCAIAVRRFFPAAVSTILITPVVDASTAELIVHLRRRGYPTVVLSPSPLAFARTVAPLGPVEEALAERLARLVRREEIGELWQEAPVIDWSDYWSLGQFVHFLGRPQTGPGGVGR